MSIPVISDIINIIWNVKLMHSNIQIRIHSVILHPTNTSHTNRRPLLLILLHPNNRRLKLPRRHLPIKQNIRLTVRPMLQLRQEEVRHHPTKQRRTPPHIPTLPRQIPPRGIQHPTRKVYHRDLRDVVSRAADGGAQRAQAHRGRLRDDRVGDGPLGAGVDDRDDDAQTGLGVVGLVVLGD